MNLKKLQLQAQKSRKQIQLKFSTLPRWIHYFLPLAFVTTTLSGLVYFVAQQNLREAANDPQIQISEDIATSLAAGQDPSQIIPSYSIDISKTLSNFVIIFDEEGKPIVSTAILDEKIPEISKGVLDFAKDHGQNRLTWAPRKDVRLAVVVTYYSDKAKGYSLVGRSLREVETRIEKLTKIIALAWGSSIIGSLFIAVLLEKLSRPSKK